MGGVWEAFLRVGGRLQMTKICVFCWLFHSNGRRETEGEKGEVESSMMRNGRRKEEGEGGGLGADTNTKLIPSELQPVGRIIVPNLSY